MVLFYCSFFPISLTTSPYFFFFSHLHPSQQAQNFGVILGSFFTSNLISKPWANLHGSTLITINWLLYLHGYCIGLNHHHLFPELLQYPPDCTPPRFHPAPAPNTLLNMARRVSLKNMKPNHILFPYKPAKGPFIFPGSQGPIQSSNSSTVHLRPQFLLFFPTLLQPSWLLTVLQTYLACFPFRIWHWLLLLPGIFFSMYLHALLFYQLAHFCSTITISTNSYLDH